MDRFRPVSLAGGLTVRKLLILWCMKKHNQQVIRKPIERAKELLAKAGWPDGRNAQTGEPLVLFF